MYDSGTMKRCVPFALGLAAIPTCYFLQPPAYGAAVYALSVKRVPV